MIRATRVRGKTRRKNGARLANQRVRQCKEIRGRLAMRVLLGAYVLLYASIHPQVPPFSDSCLWGSWHPGRQIHLFSHSVRAQPCSLECPKSHQHQHRHVPMYSAYCIPVIAAELHEYISTSICKVLPFVRSFLHLLYIYIITVP